VDDVEHLRATALTLQRQLDAAHTRLGDSGAIWQAAAAITAARTAPEVEAAMFRGLLSVSKARAAVLLRESDGVLIVVRASDERLSFARPPIGALGRRVLDGAAVAVPDISRVAEFGVANAPGWRLVRGAALLPYHGDAQRGIVALVSDEVGYFQAADAERLKAFGLIASHGVAALHRFQLYIDHEIETKARQQLEQKVRARTAELEAATFAAEEANRSKSQFLAIMSHELRTPLNAIIGYSEMLREDAADDARDDAVRDHDSVLRAARHLLHLINDLLDLSKAEAGRMEADVQAFEIAEVGRAAVETIQPKASENNNRVDLVLAGDLGTAMNDEFRLRQCLLNLLSNAAKFTRDGVITLSVRRDGAMLAFDVTDTGMGIAEDEIAGLFQPFVQANAGISRTHGGTGLGLAVTRRLAQLLGGEVRVRSVLGAGSTFTLTIAADLSAAAAPPRLAAVG